MRQVSFLFLFLFFNNNNKNPPKLRKCFFLDTFCKARYEIQTCHFVVFLSKTRKATYFNQYSLQVQFSFGNYEIKKYTDVFTTCSPALILFIFQALKGVVSQEKGKWERECVSPGLLLTVWWCFLVFLVYVFCCCCCHWVIGLLILLSMLLEKI